MCIRIAAYRIHASTDSLIGVYDDSYIENLVVRKVSYHIMGNFGEILNLANW